MAVRAENELEATLTGGMKMLLDNKAAAIVAESVLRLRDEQNKAKVRDVMRARLLYANATPPTLPGSMSDKMQTEYRLEWSPPAIAKCCVDKIMAAMYGRIVQRKVGETKQPEDVQYSVDKLLEAWDRNTARAYTRCLIHGHVVIRFFPDHRTGTVIGLYDPDEATPLYDPTTEDLSPYGIVYHYRIPASSFPLPVKALEVSILEYITTHKRDAVTGDILEAGQRKRWYSTSGTWTEWPYYDGDLGLNPYGDHLGAVVWRNDDVVGPDGESEILPIHDLLLSISHTATDLKLLLKWNVFPILASNSPGFANMPYGWRMNIELQPDGSGNKGEITRVDFSPGSLESGMNFLRLLLQLVNESTSVPAIAMGDLSDIGNLSSGRALEIVMMPLTDLTNRRQKLQAWQEEEALREMLVVWGHMMYESKKGDPFDLMTVEYEGRAYPFAHMLPISVTFGPLGLARSTEDLIAYVTQLYGGSLASLDHCVRTLHPDWTDDQVIQEIDRIKGDTQPREGNVVDEGRTARIQAMIGAETEEGA
jgi:hypothetical protein